MLGEETCTKKVQKIFLHICSEPMLSTYINIEKKIAVYCTQQNNDSNDADLSSETTEARNKWNNIFKVLRKCRSPQLFFPSL